MSQKLNPYREWFGLDTTRKPSYYELLGVQNFETEPPVIAEAAECRLQLLEPHKAGPNAELAAKLTREVTGVMNALLNPEKRRQYDDQLRRETGLAPSSIADSTDGGIEATDSPTMMLPPGALRNLPPMGGLPPAVPMPPSDPYAGYPGYGAPPGVPPQGMAGMPPMMPGYAPPGFAPAGPPMGAPAMGAAPLAASPFGGPPMAGSPMQAPQASPFGAPPMAASPFGAPQFGAPQFGTPQAPAFPGAPQAAPFGPSVGPPGYAAPAANPFGPPTAVAPMASGYDPTAPMAGGYAPSAAAPAVAPGASFSGSNVSQRGRLAGMKKQKSSTVMIAVGVLGSAAAVLTLIIFVASAKQKNSNPPPGPKLAVIPPREMNSETFAQQAAKNARNNPNYQPLPPSQTFSERLDTPGSAIRTPSPQEQMANRNAAFDDRGNLPSMPNLVQSMAPEGAKPVPAAMPSPTARPNSPFEKPPATPPTPAPSATPSATAAMPATPSTPGTPSAPAVPMIALDEPTKLEMTAVLPASDTIGKQVSTMLGAARKQMKSRDYVKAEEIVLQTQVLADTPELILTTYEHNRALEYLRAFWVGVHEGVKMLKEGDELTLDGKPEGKKAVVVKHDDLTLVVKQDGKDVVVQITKFLPGLAVKMAEKSLPADQANTKLIIAAFLALDQAGDRVKSGTMLDEAIALGSGDIVGLRSVLEATP